MNFIGIIRCGLVVPGKIQGFLACFYFARWQVFAMHAVKYDDYLMAFQS